MIRVAALAFATALLVSGWSEFAGSATAGGVSSSTLSASSPTLAVDPAGNPVVAWTEDLGGGNSEIYVRRFDGAAWVQLAGSATGGGISSTPGSSTSPALAIKASGNPVVAWVEGGLITVKRYTGVAWVPVGSPFGGPAAERPSLALNSLGDPIVAWHDLVAGGNIYVRMWDGASWSALPGSDINAGIATVGISIEPRVVLSALDVVSVAWTEDTGAGNTEIYVATNDGAAWVGLAASFSGGGVSGSAAASSPALALDASGNPVVAWSEDVGGGNHEIYLRQFDGLAWIEVAGSATGGGISSSASDSAAPSLVMIEGSVTPALAWSEDVGGSGEIYVRRLSAGSWVEVQGSATGGGVSSTAFASLSPTLASATNNALSVAWLEDVTGTFQVHVRGTTGAAGSGTSGVTVSAAKQKPLCGLLGAEVLLILCLVRRRTTQRGATSSPS